MRHGRVERLVCGREGVVEEEECEGGAEGEEGGSEGDVRRLFVVHCACVREAV